MRLSYLYESLIPEPRSSLSGRIMALRDKTKVIEQPAREVGLDKEVEYINGLIMRAQKNKVAILTKKILKKAEEHLNSLIAKLMKYGKKPEVRQKQNIRDTAKVYLDKLPPETRTQIANLNVIDELD